MSQFFVYQNRNSQTKKRIPYLLNIQSNLLNELETRVVAPLEELKGKPLTVLMPVLSVEGKPYVMLTPQLAGISKKELGARMADLSSQKNEIMAALDFLITGI